MDPAPSNTANRNTILLTLQQVSRDLSRLMDMAVNTDGIGIADIRIGHAILEISEAIHGINAQWNKPQD
jgi:hypothetical protein